MQLIRNEAVAGLFYPADPKTLSTDIGRFLNQKPIVEKQRHIQGIVVPHAGYIYSGDCAGTGYAAIRDHDFDIAIILSPSHYSNQFTFSPGKYSHYRTPLGNLKVNQEWLAEFDHYPEFQFNAPAHEKEHALEVQLPFLQIIKPGVEIVPILLGRQSLENSRILAQILNDIQAKRKEKIMLIISTDLSHYHSQSIAEKMDKTLQSNMESLSLEALENDLSQHNIEACGIGGLFFLLAWSQNLSSPAFSTLQYAHSGLVNHREEEVVGYMAGILTGGM